MGMTKTSQLALKEMGTGGVDRSRQGLQVYVPIWDRIGSMKK